MPLYCPRFKAIALHENTDKRLLARLGCNQWDCQICAKKMRSKWRAHLENKCNKISSEWSFHTLTVPDWIHELETPEDRCLASLARIRGGWDKFMKAMKRKFGNFQYVRVFEKHESGALHIHFLASFHLPPDDLKMPKKKNAKFGYSRWIKDNAPLRGFGFITSSANLPTGASVTVMYVTKYMTKEDDFVKALIGKYRIRRIQTSQGIGSPKTVSELDWTMRGAIEIEENRKKPYFDVSARRYVNDEDFEGGLYFPPLSHFEDLA
jgi:hypothetical protein